MSVKLNIEELKEQYVNKTFNLLTVLDVIRGDNNRVQFVCKCECGNIKNIDKNKVLRGDILSCGCYRESKKISNLKQIADSYINKTFDWLTITDVCHKNNSITAICKCKCGNITTATIRELKSGHKKSCGCYSKSEEFACKCKQWYIDNPDKVIEKENKHKQWFKDNPDKVKEHTENYKLWCENNPDKVKERAEKHSQWFKDNPDKVKAIGKCHAKWFKDNTDKVISMVIKRKMTISNQNIDIKTNSSNFKHKRKLNIKSLTNNPTSDFTDLLNSIHPSQKQQFLDGDISSHDFINLKCPICNTYCNHTLKSTFIISKGAFKHGNIPMCQACTNKLTTSKYEDEIEVFIKSFYDGEVIRNTRDIINPLELDIYIPDKNIAIEYNGSYWHDENHKDKNYHVNKYLKCKGNNILLISIFESEWNVNKDKIKEYIKDTFNNLENELSFTNGYMNNNYPSIKRPLCTEIIYDSYIYNNQYVYTCGFSKLCNIEGR